MAAKETSEVKVRIRLRAYENKILDKAVEQIMEIILRHDAKVRGPVPLPNEIEKYTVNRSTFVHKDAREQFEVRVHKRLIDIINPQQSLVDALMKLELASGVDIQIKMA